MSWYDASRSPRTERSASAIRRRTAPGRIERRPPTRRSTSELRGRDRAAWWSAVTGQRQRRRSRPRPSSDRTRSGVPAACPECDGRLVGDDETTETVCTDCGLVVDERELDTGPEWRAFTAAERDEKSRVGSPTTPLMHDRGLATEIGWNGDAGAAIRNRKELSRLRTWQRRFRTEDAHDRNLKQALGEIKRMGSALGLPASIRETASVVYRQALKNDLLPGRSIEGMASASLYAAARLDGVARSIEEVAEVSRVDDIEIKRAYRYLSRELDLEIPPTNPVEYVSRFASQLGCSDAVERRARDLIEVATEEGVHSGKHPAGIAASALYAAARLLDEGTTQADVSEVANVSKVTIRNRYQEILEAAERAGQS
ncbi:MAG: transcription initiation factor IIB family protein [Haloferacaceae archaeon]